MKKNNMVAMILAGGRGSRLYDLTNRIAKPAVHYGGKYRIIDFPLSNCANSGINTVGVLLQYESIELGSYVTRDYTWGLNDGGGVFAISPREKNSSDIGVYRGTADAITQNLDFLDNADADYVLILSGDHIYKMNYEKMLKAHIAANAEATIAVMEVPLKEASRFGIMNTDKSDRIIEFEEKPAKPKSNLASMGIYIFSYKTLRKYLKADDKKTDSNHDFGKDIIPLMIYDKLRVQAYRFEGYWKDVGTIDSLWEANMDLLNPSNTLDLFDPDWKIYTDDGNPVPQSIGKNAKIKSAYITQGARVDGEIEHSVIFTNCFVKEGAYVADSVLMTNVEVGSGAKLYRCLVADNTKIPANMKLGKKDSDEILLVTNDLVNQLGGKRHDK